MDSPSTLIPTNLQQVLAQAQAQQPVQVPVVTAAAASAAAAAVPSVAAPAPAAVAQVTSNSVSVVPNVVTIPVPIVHNEENYAYITVKGSLHDRTCTVFGLNEPEIQALTKRYENGVKPVVNGVMISIPPIVMVNTMAQLGYKVVCSCGEAEICWTMQREI